MISQLQALLLQFMLPEGIYTLTYPDISSSLLIPLFCSPPSLPPPVPPSFSFSLLSLLLLHPSSHPLPPPLLLLLLFLPAGPWRRSAGLPSGPPSGWWEDVTCPPGDSASRYPRQPGQQHDVTPLSDHRGICFLIVTITAIREMMTVPFGVCVRVCGLVGG